jgi:predicted DsbA family dithiol-disulfide isomerase
VHELVRFDPAVKIVWRAFELRPEPVGTLDPKGEYLQRVWENSVYPNGREARDGDETSASAAPLRLAHDAAHWAVSKDGSTTTTRRFFAPFLKEGKISAGQRCLLPSQTELGLSSESLRDALESRQFEMSVRDDEREADASGQRRSGIFCESESGRYRRTTCRQFKEVN